MARNRCDKHGLIQYAEAQSRVLSDEFLKLESIDYRMSID